MRKKENYAELTKEEYSVLSMIFNIGLDCFLDKMDFMSCFISYNVVSDIISEYTDDRIEIIENIAKKFDIDIERILEKYEM